MQSLKNWNLKKNAKRKQSKPTGIKKQTLVKKAKKIAETINVASRKGKLQLSQGLPRIDSYLITSQIGKAAESTGLQAIPVSKHFVRQQAKKQRAQKRKFQEFNEKNVKRIKLSAKFNTNAKQTTLKSFFKPK